MTVIRTVRLGASPLRVMPVVSGPPGPAGMVWRGAWSSATKYVVLDGVSHDGASYICTAAVGPVGTTPDVDTAHWDLLARAGVDGVDGTGTMNGPGSSVDGHLAVWDGTSGTLVKDGGPPLIIGTTAGTAMEGDKTFATTAQGAKADTALQPTDFGTAAGDVAEGNDPRFVGVGITDKSAAYTLTAADAGTVIRSTAATAITITVPDSVFTAGQIVEIMQYGTGQVTVAAGAGVTLRSTATAPLKISDQYAALSILFLSASEAVVTGGLA